MEEQKLLDMLLARSDRAVQELEGQYGRLVGMIANNILGSPEDASECTNDTWLAVWNSIPPNRPDSLMNYVCRIAKNIALKRFRDDHRRKRSGMTVALDELADCLAGVSLEDAYAEQEIIRAMNVYIGTLDKENRFIWVCHFWTGASAEEIAERLGMTKGAVVNRLSRMRKGLRKYLGQEGLV